MAGALASIPGVSTLLRSSKLVEFTGWLLHYDGTLTALRNQSSKLARIVVRVPFVKFVEIWKWMRMTIDLQTRLYLEQVFTELGPPYSDLVTQFKPIELRERTLEKDYNPFYRQTRGKGGKLVSAQKEFKGKLKP